MNQELKKLIMKLFNNESNDESSDESNDECSWCNRPCYDEDLHKVDGDMICDSCFISWEYSNR